MQDTHTVLDELIGEVEDCTGERQGLRLKVALLEEVHDSQSLLADFLPCLSRRSRRMYLRGEPYVLVPQYSFDVVLSPAAAPDGALGKVVRASLEGMAHQRVGSCRAWAVPEAGVVLLWEAYLFLPWRRSPDPREDEGARLLWQAWEQTLLRLVPEARELRAPPREPVYDTDFYRAFLAEMGYHPLPGAPFWAKEVS